MPKRCAIRRRSAMLYMTIVCMLLVTLTQQQDCYFSSYWGVYSSILYYNSNYQTDAILTPYGSYGDGICVVTYTCVGTWCNNSPPDQTVTSSDQAVTYFDLVDDETGTIDQIPCIGTKTEDLTAPATSFDSCTGAWTVLA